MIKSSLKALAVAGTLLAAGTAAAFPLPATLTNSNGSFTGWGGFDWASNGTAIVDGFNPFVASSTFDLTYFASAATVTNEIGAIIGGASAGILLGDYEYTIVLKMNETSSCTSFGGVGGSCDAADFSVNGGSFEIYYDVAPNASQTTGTGFTDGELLIAGFLGGQAGGAFNVVEGGNAILAAVITYTNAAYIDPVLAGSNAATTLQVGSNLTGWAPTSGIPVADGLAAALPAGSFQLQADGNQQFQTIPEPGTLALLGLALGGVGVMRRRKAA